MSTKVIPMLEVGRLAMRQEGDNWNAYYAPAGTMDGAVFLGSIRLAFLAKNPERREAFLHLMREAVGDIIERHTGMRPTWNDPQPAPESERTKNA